MNGIFFRYLVAIGMRFKYVTAWQDLTFVDPHLSDLFIRTQTPLSLLKRTSKDQSEAGLEEAAVPRVQSYSNEDSI